MPKTLVPTEFKTHIIDQLIESINEVSNTVYYAFIGDHLAEGSTIEEVNDINETVRDINSEIFRNMIIGKKLSNDDFKVVVNRYDWVAGTTYTMYDDQEIELADKNFYVTVDEDSFKHVYKCLYNAGGQPSTTKPLFEDARYDADLFVSGDDYYETNDGYQWKYLFSINSLIFNKFATEKYIPLVANTAIQNNANPGSIDVIRVITAGKNYNNSVTDQFTANDFDRITPTIAGNIAIIQGGQILDNPSLWYRIKNGKQIVDFYKNTVLYISGGVAAGEYKRIVRSDIVTGVGVVVQVESNFSIEPDETSSYEIFPEVRITGDGSETQRAFARAIINADAANSISQIEMFETGRNYKYAEAEILTGAADEIDGNAIVPIKADLRAILPPQGGHGANNQIELFAKRISISGKFSRDEAGLVSPENTFGQFGILRDPRFANTQFFFEDSTGNFIENEKIIQFSKDRLAGSWTSNSSVNNFVIQSSSEGEYASFFDIGEKLYITTDAGQYYIGTVAAGSNTTAIALANSIPFIVDATNTTLNVFKAKEISTCTVNNSLPPRIPGQPVGVNNFLANDVIPKFVTGELIYGESSRSVANVVGIDINNRIGTYDAAFDFSNYNQLFKILGQTTSGVFQNDEKVRQISPSTQLESTGFVHTSNSTVLSLTRVEGDFVTGENASIDGLTSQAQFNDAPGDTLDIVYGDLDSNFGSIIYVQNDIPVDRDGNQTEEVRVILEF